MESRLRGGEAAAPWVWEEALVHAESGLAPECSTGKCSDTHTIVGKNGCLYYAIFARGTPAQGQLPDTASCLAHSRGHKLLLQGLTVLKRRPCS